MSPVAEKMVTAGDLYADIFSGFVFWFGALVMSIIILIIKGKAKKAPTVGKRNALITLSVIVTVFDALLLLFKVNFIAFLINPYTYFMNNYTLSKYDGAGSMVKGVYIGMYIAIICIIIFGAFAAVAGFKAASRKNFRTLSVSQHTMPPAQGMPQKQIPVDGILCPFCHKVNKVGSSFCAACGKPFIREGEVKD